MFNIENSLSFLLAKCHQKSFNSFKLKLEPYNLTPPQFATLAFLWKKDGINQIQLGELMSVDRTTISGIVDRLERMALVERGDDPGDRRSWVLFLTETGKALQTELASLAEEFNIFLAGSLSSDELGQVIQSLKKIRQA